MWEELWEKFAKCLECHGNSHWAFQTQTPVQVEMEESLGKSARLSGKARWNLGSVCEVCLDCDRGSQESEWGPPCLSQQLCVPKWVKNYHLLVTAAAAAKSCPTLCSPIDGSPPGSPSLRFSRQEHWSGLPFPSPMHESEKWKWSRSVVSDPQRPHGLQPSRLLRPWEFPGKSAGVGCHCLCFLANCLWASLIIKPQWNMTSEDIYMNLIQEC